MIPKLFVRQYVMELVICAYTNTNKVSEIESQNLSGKTPPTQTPFKKQKWIDSTHY